MKGIYKIVLWLGVTAFLTVVAMGLWYLLCHGSQTTASLKWLQFMQTLGTFALPPILCAWWWSEDHRPFQWLKINQSCTRQTAALAMLIMIFAIPAINLMADLNSRIELPKSLDFIEQFLHQQEDTAAALTERFLQADNVGGLLLNLGLMAFLPAFAEELTFRGTLQTILTNGDQRKAHVAIWVTAFIFSAIHMQFYGFIPRMLMGALFGYALLWTGSLWVPILMHFTNNGLAVLTYYIVKDPTKADSIGAGSTWWLGLISLVLVALATRALFLTSQGQLKCGRRTHTE